MIRKCLRCQTRENGPLIETLRFSATLTRQPDSSATLLAVPVDVFRIFGTRGRVPVAGTVNGTPFRSSIVPYGGVHYLSVNRDLRERAGVKPGDLVEVVMVRDDEPRIPALPEDLDKALQNAPQARKNWKKLAPIRQQELLEELEASSGKAARAAKVQSLLRRLLEVKYHTG